MHHTKKSHYLFLILCPSILLKACFCGISHDDKSCSGGGSNCQWYIDKMQCNSHVAEALARSLMLPFHGSEGGSNIFLCLHMKKMRNNTCKYTVYMFCFHNLRFPMNIVIVFIYLNLFKWL